MIASTVLGSKSPHLTCLVLVSFPFSFLSFFHQTSRFPPQTAGFCVGSVHGNMKLNPDVQVSCEMFKVQVKWNIKHITDKMWIFFFLRHSLSLHKHTHVLISFNTFFPAPTLACCICSLWILTEIFMLLFLHCCWNSPHLQTVALNDQTGSVSFAVIT